MKQNIEMDIIYESTVGIGVTNTFYSTICMYFQIPDSGLTYLSERILLFIHDYSTPNVLHIINSAAEVVDETLVEIVLTASRKY